MAEVATGSCGSWSEFKTDAVRELYRTEGCFTTGRFLFRGQGRGDWRLTTSFDRWYRESLGENRLEIAKALIDQFALACEDQGRLGSPNQFETLALAQHYGVPTTLLDWTESPYIAAFFAYHSHIELDADPDGTVAVWALNLSAPIWKADLGVEILRAPRLGDVRLRNQAGLFTLSRTPFDSLEEYVGHCKWQGTALHRFLLPASDARAALSDLGAMGITPSRMFPDLEGAAARARQEVLLSRKG